MPGVLMTLKCLVARMTEADAIHRGVWTVKCSKRQYFIRIYAFHVPQMVW